MITLATLKALKNNEGLTLKRFNSITYKTGYQVATEGKETTSAVEALAYIVAYAGNCGVWYSEGVYYIDKSYRVNTKKEALKVGRECNQLSVLKWSNMSLVWC